MKQPNYEQAKRYALDRLQRELSPQLYYHSLAHTRDDVLVAAQRFAKEEQVDDATLLLVCTAAVYHDVGYVIQRDEHEAAGVVIAREVLPKFGYDPAQIQAISGMIMATRLPQTPHNLLEEIIADADMDSLGRNDFLTISFNLQSELAAVGMVVEDKDWLARQKRFLESHRYFTNAARRLRDEGKQNNIQLLERMIAEHDHQRG